MIVVKKSPENNMDEVQGLSAISANKIHRTSHYEPTTKDSKKQILRAYQWINDIDYNGRRINWLQCHEVITWTKESKYSVKEEKSKGATFVHITNIVGVLDTKIQFRFVT